MTNKIVVLVTCGSMKEARRLAKAIVGARLAACVSVATAPVESVYRWKGRVERAREYLMLIKTTRKRFAVLRREVERLHSYDVPEIIALPISAGSPGYLNWLNDSVRAAPERRLPKTRKPPAREV